MMIPEFMQAIEIEADNLQLTARLMPKPASHQVLIKVAAAGVNRPDIAQRKGLYPAPAGASDILGLEVAGTIVTTGVAVSHLKVGDTVCALVTGGGYAGYCLASAL
jgi:NADPH2:quinone reductase